MIARAVHFMHRVAAHARHSPAGCAAAASARTPRALTHRSTGGDARRHAPSRRLAACAAQRAVISAIALCAHPAAR